MKIYNDTISAENPDAERTAGSLHQDCSAAREYWLYVWSGSKYRLGHPVEYSDPPQKFTAICDGEASEIAAERAADAVMWELHDGNAMDEKTKQIASKHRPLVMPNDRTLRPAK